MTTPTFAPGDPATWTHRRPHTVPLRVPVTVLEAAQGRVRISAPLTGGGAREVVVWERELREREAS